MDMSIVLYDRKNGDFYYSAFHCQPEISPKNTPQAEMIVCC